MSGDIILDADGGSIYFSYDLINCFGNFSGN